MTFLHNSLFFQVKMYYNVYHHTLHKGNDKVLIFIKKVLDCSHIMVIGALYEVLVHIRHSWRYVTHMPDLMTFYTTQRK